MNKILIFVILVAAIYAQFAKPKPEDKKKFRECLKECQGKGEERMKCAASCSESLGIDTRRRKKAVNPLRNNPGTPTKESREEIVKCMKECKEEGKPRIECMKKCRPQRERPQKNIEKINELRECMKECRKEKKNFLICSKECREKNRQPSENKP